MSDIRPPTAEELSAYQREQFPSTDDIHLWPQSVAHFTRSFERLSELANPPLSPRYPRRDPGRAPRPSEDPLNALVRLCEVTGAGSGPLAGRRLGVKDSIPVAAVPMTGCENCALPVPAEDAAVVERLLSAGASVAAKTNVSFPGVGEVTDAQRVRNPHDTRFSPGGSSSGSAAAVATRLVDIALGTDAAGSVRIPAAWSGLVGMKPTRGLVPLHGCRDHITNAIGPITRTVAENAMMMDAMAGPDWRDPLSACARPKPDPYHKASEHQFGDLTLGVVAESLTVPECTGETLTAFENAERILRGMGARVQRVSIPLWPNVASIFWPIHIFGLVAEARSFGSGYGNLGRVDERMVDNMLCQYHGDTQRSLRLMIEHLRHSHKGEHFWKASNLSIQLGLQVEAALKDVALLLTPTTPSGPVLIDGRRDEATGETVWAPMEAATANTWAFNLTGHPALTVPVGHHHSGLPTGLQIIGRMYDEFTIYRAAFAYERATS